MRYARLALPALTVLVACHRSPKATTPPAAVEAGPQITFSGKKVRSYTDTFAVISIADSPSTLWVGTTRGLIKWDVAAGKYTVIGAREGLPAEKITAVT